jgi:hypothetical protein
MDRSSIEERLIVFASEYIKAYTNALDKNFEDTLEILRSTNLITRYFPLYGRTLGANCSIASFIASASLQIFFFAEKHTEIRALKFDREWPEFNQRWTFDTPSYIRKGQATELLDIDPQQEIWFLDVPATNPLGLEVDDESCKHIAQEAGRNAGNEAGARAQADIPAILAGMGRANKVRGFSERYTALSSTTGSPQQRGIDFEQLWREVMTFYGWYPKKFGVPGENNDFTAIYDGTHILAEVRWYSEQMNGGKMREFLAKLDARPRTIGLFISQSGYDNGAVAAVRRSVNSKTVVLFSRLDIEAVLLEGRDPGPIFREKVRDVYDLLFEETIVNPIAE